LGIFSSLFGSGKVVDKVAPEVRRNTEAVGVYMKSAHETKSAFSDFTFSYLYTISEPITQGGVYGSVIYTKVDSPVHANIAGLEADSKVDPRPHRRDRRCSRTDLDGIRIRSNYDRTNRSQLDKGLAARGIT